METKVIILIVLLTGAAVYMLNLIWEYVFPPKAAFTTEKDFKEFLKLNEKQYKQIVAEVKSDMAKDMVSLLELRDKAVNQNISEAEINIRKAFNGTADQMGNKISALAATVINNHALAMSLLADTGILGDELKDMKPEEKFQYFVQEVLTKQKGIKELVHVVEK